MTYLDWFTNQVNMASKQGQLIHEILQCLEVKAPLSLAEEWDLGGLLVGDPVQRTMGAVISIDLNDAAVELALQKKYSLIVTHHPCIFPKGKGLNAVVAGTPIFKALQHGISVMTAHTQFDRCALEVCERVSTGLGFQPQGRFMGEADQDLVKLVVFVPPSHLEQIRQSLFQAGAGHIGQYDQCSFGVSGEGTFRGSSSSRPWAGQAQVFEKVAEVRLEVIFLAGFKKSVVAALLKSHPYEEVAYDLCSVQKENVPVGIVRGLGYGVWGEFPHARLFSDVVKDVKSLFGIQGFWITNPVPSTVTKIGFVAGKGSSFVEQAWRLKCDLLITGEVGYHSALAGSTRGLSVMEIGHQQSEKFFVETLKNWFLELGLECAEAMKPTQIVWQEV